jgi:hypothetical protein
MHLRHGMSATGETRRILISGEYASERVGHRIDEHQPRAWKQSVGQQFGIAMGWQLAPSSQMTGQQIRRLSQRQPPIRGIEVSNWRRPVHRRP